MGFVTMVLSFIFVLGVLVFVHELGHFLVAKRAGIRVEQFSLGYPPKAFGVTIGETEYCLSWLPLGGYVKVSGMADFGQEEVKGEPWEFQSKPRWVQMAVMVAGPIMNFLLGFVIILGVLVGVGAYTYKTTQIGRLEASSPLWEAGLRPGDRVTLVGADPVGNWKDLSEALEKAAGKTVLVGVDRAGEALNFSLSLGPGDEALEVEPYTPSMVGNVFPGYPAEKTGLMSGDHIVFIDGVEVTQWWEMSREISARPGKAFEIRWLRDGGEMSAQIVPQEEKDAGRVVGRIGISASMQMMDRAPVTFAQAVPMSARRVVGYTTMIFSYVKKLVVREASARTLAGPLGIMKMAGQSARQGWEDLLQFMALLSVNLAVLNLLPIPMLDGGHLTILIVEGIARRDLSVRQKEVLQQMGFAFLLMLMIFVTFNDIIRFFG